MKIAVIINFTIIAIIITALFVQTKRLNELREISSKSIEQYEAEKTELLDLIQITEHRITLSDSLSKLKFNKAQNENLLLVNRATLTDLRSILKSAAADTARYNLPD